jgi:hypothetical protein
MKNIWGSKPLGRYEKGPALAIRQVRALFRPCVPLVDTFYSSYLE